MPGTTFTVDAFKYGALDFCTAYFLTHFHSDHYGGLTKGFAGEIYCSRITANLVISKFRIDPRQVHALPMNTRCIVQGVYVTLIDARHCPGAAIILFEVPEGGKLMRIVHTGDFRAADRHVLNAVHTSPMVDYIYLDTTYLEPTYSFPKQHQVVDVVGEFCYRIDSDSEYLPAALNLLFVVGTYTIGKEKLFIEIARRLRSKIYVPQDKRRLLDCFQSTSLSNMLTDAMDEAQVHAVPMSMVNMRGMAEYLHTVQAAAPSFTRVVAFSPTGWSHAGPYIPGRQHTPSPIPHMSDDSGESFGVEKLKPRGLSDRVAIFPVPYSEHSSFAELARFVCSLKAGQVLPTVYSTSDKNRQANDWLCHW
ncbi:DRMBL-domain-containing protein, partial [Martensiomyces pterosporus]